ncbi:MAG: hypothetical protein AUI09_03375 [Gemmatimonadetes bacterium 13_2_20CM_2_66_5]|nr:MAG: hypothetical protein AUI09_03375 [Gemmatimonadetes bacterium 13_2_20CM_2_66_5]
MVRKRMRNIDHANITWPFVEDIANGTLKAAAGRTFQIGEFDDCHGSGVRPTFWNADVLATFGLGVRQYWPVIRVCISMTTASMSY